MSDFILLLFHVFFLLFRNSIFTCFKHCPHRFYTLFFYSHIIIIYFTLLYFILYFYFYIIMRNIGSNTDFFYTFNEVIICKVGKKFFRSTIHRHKPVLLYLYGGIFETSTDLLPAHILSQMYSALDKGLP